MDFIKVSGVEPLTVENRLEFAINHVKKLRPSERVVDSYYMDDKPIIIAIDNMHCVWRYTFIFDKSIMYSIELF